VQKIKTGLRRKFTNFFLDPTCEILMEIKVIFSLRFLRFLFLLSIIFRLLFLKILHPNQPSSFAPDEGTYASLAEYISSGLAVQNFPEYVPALYKQSMSLVGPSSLLIKAGVDPLQSVRILSTIYGFLVPIMVLLCLVAVRKSEVSFEKLNREIKSPLAVSILIFLFLIPSNFLWSTLGLRESASQFWILAQTYFMIKVFQSKNSTILQFGFLALISSVFSFGSRPQTALMLSIFLIALGILVALRKRALSFLLVSIFSILAGNAFAGTPEVKLVSTWSLIKSSDVEQIQKPKIGEEERDKLSEAANNLCSISNQRVRISNVDYKCVLIHVEKKSLILSLTSLPTNIDVSTLEERRNTNRIGASSALAPSSCYKLFDELTSLKCNISEIPYRLSAFLLRPFLLIDHGSSFLLLAGLENVAWTLLFILTFYNLAKIRRKTPSKEYLFSVTAFLVLFSTAAALYEGNLGTAFRHKSTIIGHLVLINLIAISSRELKSQGSSTQN